MRDRMRDHVRMGASSAGCASMRYGGGTGANTESP